MKGRWALLVNGLLALAIVGSVAACGGDDDDDDNGGSGGSAGSAGSAGSKAGTGGSTAGSGGSTAGSGGGMAMVTPEMCVANSMKETTKTTMACLTCVCGKNASVIDKVGMNGWKLIECIGEKCDGDGTATMCITTNCMAEVTAGVMEATPTASVFPMCKMECGIGDMTMMPGDDGGTQPSGGDAGL